MSVPERASGTTQRPAGGCRRVAEQHLWVPGQRWAGKAGIERSSDHIAAV